MSDSQIIELSSEALAHFKGLKIKNRRKLIEGVLDFWEGQLFPVLEEQCIPKYEFVCSQILHKAGYEDFTPEVVRQKVYQIHKSRRKSGMAASNPPEQAHRPITTPIAMKEVVAPLVTSQAPARPVVVPGAAPQGRIEITWKWAEELERLENEAFNAEWTPQDELLQNYFKQEALDNFRDPEDYFHELYKLYQGGYKKSVLMKINNKWSFMSK
ncbi:TPA: hypothetical protein QDB51_002693 [Burkholderia vietnamiensis]|nr:hypothetical protein [Burkholderia vietnamiensis]